MNEAEYICFLAKGLIKGLYQQGGYCVLPHFSQDPKAVYFPDLNNSKRFWRALARTKSFNFGDKYPEAAVTEVAAKLKVNKTSRSIKKDGLNIELLETEFGTRGSYFAKGNKVYMTQRKGNKPEDFERTLIMAKLKIKNKDDAEIGDPVWHGRMAIGNYFYETKKSKLTHAEIKESNGYLKKLGFYYDSIVKKINYKDLTLQEDNLLRSLIKAKGEIITFDNAAQILWGENSYEKYSLEAMAKVVENLRRKIKEQRINNEVIFTKRGKGYFFYG